MRRAAKIDKNQPAIVKGLRRVGVQVIIPNAGDDFPDIITCYRNSWVLIEIKDQNTPMKRGQMQFLADAKGKVGIAMNCEEALSIAKGEGVLTDKQKNNIAVFLRTFEGKTMAIRKFLRECGIGGG